MTNRERFDAVLNYREYDRIPLVHFGYWNELIEEWEQQGHLPSGTAEEYRKHRFPTGSDIEKEIDKNFGWDFAIYNVAFANRVGYMDILDPMFEHKIIRELPSGDKHELIGDGTIVLQKYDENGNKVTAMPVAIDYTLVDEESWRKEYLPRLTWFEERFDKPLFERLEKEAPTREDVICLYGGSVIGILRNYLGLENMIMIQYEEPEFLKEMIQVQQDCQYKLLERALSYKIDFDYVYLWEDMTCKQGPLIDPVFFDEVAGPYYKKVTELLKSHGIHNIIMDTDGVPEKLMPTWVNNGINIMWPIEVGTWGGNFAPYREKYGKKLRGMGGVRKHAMAEDKAAVDREVERMKPLVELGGYIPCPDHSLPQGCKWELVQYYVERMFEEFGK